ncbi:hypothetical protein Ddye_029742 [Dipteronia dyeriana]|uniref:MULE transposase domain-containing protein n=1 Tax=Dipteronia dyeriana TaxID=168575 RepID=A0AAD9WM03_9ROSI|nr:hypothetical protein Ddye_029742 [Dipteronia dyeriana]
MAIRASIDGFNYVIRLIICIDVTHLKARTRGVLLVAVCKDGNVKIYPLTFGFTNSECIESWTWFLKKLSKLIQYSNHVMLVSDRHNGIFNVMEAIFPDAAHGICAYHLAQNLKRFYKQRDDVISLYYRAMYAYHIEDFNHLMAELKETYRKVYDELQGVGIKKFSRVHSPRKRLKCPDKPADPTLIGTEEVDDNIAVEPLVNEVEENAAEEPLLNDRADNTVGCRGWLNPHLCMVKFGLSAHL